MAEGCAAPEKGRQDWAGDWRSLAGLWALPLGSMLAATLLSPAPRGVVWVAMLAWMGVACLANARRCSRTHCRITGPFFLIMAVAVASYAVGLLPLGDHGWTLLGVVTLLGFAILWWGSERLLGRFTPRQPPQ